MSRYVIIGNGPAAASCIDGIRSVDKDGGITVISKEKRNAYFRPLISYYLEQKSKPENISCREEGFYEKNDAETIFDTAVKIDREKKTVVTEGGKEIGYEKLLVAAGSSPFVPPIKGLETVEKKFTFLTMDDALDIEKAINEKSRVLIIGAGLIGLKCAEGIKDRVKSVTVADLAPRVLSSILDDDCAAIVQKHLEQHGIVFTLSNTAEHFEDNTAFMKDGTEITFDVLVLALGVRPNIKEFQEIGGKTDRAILVNEKMETSVENIYAAGDCAQQQDITFGAPRIMAILPNANIGGKTAGVNMAGGDLTFDNALPMNAIGFWGLHMMTAGTYAAGGESEMLEEKTEGGVRRFFIKDGKLIGFIIIGDVRGAGIYTNLIRKETPLDEVDFDILKKNPSLLAFGENYRSQNLKGVV